MLKRKAKKLLVIGWDAADWKIINPLMDAGLMPTLNKLVNEGVIGNLATLDPPLSPILWTSIATGKLADKHGILGFVEPNPDKQSVRPVLGTSRKVKAIWNILTQHQFKTHVVGWWPSHPAEPINGIMVSNFYQRSVDALDKPWPIADGTVYPKSKEDIFAELRLHPAEISLSHLAPLIPEWKKIDQEKDKRLVSTANMLAQCSSIHNACTWIMENEDWDFLAVYHDAIDHFCHAFMKFHPPHRPGVPQDLYEIYKDAVNGIYRFHDMMLERLLKLAGDDATVMILSDHGFHSDHLRPNRLPKEPAGPAHEHAPFGILAVKGPGIQKDQRVYGATLLDIAPTILSMFGLPVGSDMDGKVLNQIFTEPDTPEFIDSWENVEGNSGQHPSDKREDPWAAQEAMKQLIELGYVDAPGDDKLKNIDKITRESQYYLSRVYIYKREYEKSAAILETIFAADPELRYGISLITCYQAMRKVPELRSAIERVRKLETDKMVQLDLMEAALLLLEYKPRQALEILHNAEQTSSHLPYLHTQIGKIYIRIQKFEDAIRAFHKALNIDSQYASAHHGLGIAYLRNGEFEEAANSCLDAIGLMYHFPQAHYHLGEALFNLKEYEKAAEAFEVCVALTPGNRKAHHWLIKIYENHINQPDKAALHKQFVRDKIKGTITVVSGLPRSGTSLMMQMLKAGGAEILTDGKREQDNSNPKGYLEYEKVKKMMTDVSWLPEANGKVVKIVAPLLHYLPGGFDYKIIFMDRDIDEILTSQSVMLGKPIDINKNYPVVLADAFKKQLEKSEAFIKSNPNIETIHVSYSQIIENPMNIAEKIASFLEEDLDLEAMTKAVDTNLYRNRLEKNI